MNVFVYRQEKKVIGWVAKGFWALWNNIYDFVCCYIRYHDNAFKGFWVLCDIY
jgi:hypothetical protein